MKAKSKRAQWEAVFENWKQSGKSQVNFCKENDINIRTFGYWKKILYPRKNLFLPIKVREPNRNDSIFYKVESSLGINIIIPAGANAEDLTVIFKSLGLTT